MKRIKTLKAAFAFLIIFQISYSILERLRIVPQMTAFPLYNWELGFGHIPKYETMGRVYLFQVNNKVYSPPVSLKKWKEQQNDWIVTNDYKVPLFLVHQFKKSDTDGANAKLTFEERFFSPHKNIEYIKYQVLEVTFDSLEYYMKQKVKDTEEIGIFEYKRIQK